MPAKKRNRQGRDQADIEQPYPPNGQVRHEEMSAGKFNAGIDRELARCQKNVREPGENRDQRRKQQGGQQQHESHDERKRHAQQHGRADEESHRREHVNAQFAQRFESHPDEKVDGEQNLHPMKQIEQPVQGKRPRLSENMGQGIRFGVRFHPEGSAPDQHEHGQERKLKPDGKDFGRMNKENPHPGQRKRVGDQHVPLQENAAAPRRDHPGRSRHRRPAAGQQGIANQDRRDEQGSRPSFDSCQSKENLKETCQDHEMLSGYDQDMDHAGTHVFIKVLSRRTAAIAQQQGPGHAQLARRDRILQHVQAPRPNGSEPAVKRGVPACFFESDRRRRIGGG